MFGPVGDYSRAFGEARGRASIPPGRLTRGEVLFIAGQIIAMATLAVIVAMSNWADQPVLFTVPAWLALPFVGGLVHVVFVVPGESPGPDPEP